MTQSVSVPDVELVDTELFGVPELHSAYLLDATAPVLVDTGAAPAADVVETALHDHGVDADSLAGIVATHVHLDHAGAVGDLASRFPNATVYVHERGREYLTNSDSISRLVASARDAMGDAVVAAYGDPTPVPSDRVTTIADGDTIDCGDRALEVVHTPGHAPHQVALSDAASGALFAADAAGMFLDGELLPTTPAPDFDLAASLDTIDRLRALDPTTLCYGHYGVRADATTALDAYASLLPEWVADVERALDDPAHDDIEEAIDALRETWASPTLERDVYGVERTLPSTGGEN